MANKKKDVNFPCEISSADNCICSACHGLGRVVKLQLPETLYHRMGEGLSTEYTSYWLCLNCRKKLMQSLMWGNEDGKID